MTSKGPGESAPLGVPSRQHALDGEERVDAEHHGRQDPSGALGQEVDLDVSVGFEHEGLKAMVFTHILMTFPMLTLPYLRRRPLQELAHV